MRITKCVKCGTRFIRPSAGAIYKCGACSGGYCQPIKEDEMRKDKPELLTEAWVEATGNTVGMEPLNEALAKRGGKIVWEPVDRLRGIAVVIRDYLNPQGDEQDIQWVAKAIRARLPAAALAAIDEQGE